MDEQINQTKPIKLLSVAQLSALNLYQEPTLQNMRSIVSTNITN